MSGRDANQFAADAGEQQDYADASLVIVAFRAADDNDLTSRVEALLKGASDKPDTEAHVWVRKVGPDAPRGIVPGPGELCAGDLAKLADIIGWPAVERLNVGLPWGVTERLLSEADVREVDRD